jgi:transcriptional regulator GlxA family with amidase domain
MNIAVLLYNEVSELEAFGLYSVLSAAKALLPEGEHEVYTVARSRMSVQTLGGLVVTPHWAFMSAPEPDVLVVPGGQTQTVRRDRAVTSYLDAHAARVSICVALGTGAFLLGDVGLVRDMNAAALGDMSEVLRDFEVGEIHDVPLVQNDNGRWFAGRGLAAVGAGLELTRSLFGEDVAAQVRAQLALA